MIRYYPASSLSAGRALSDAMWQLCLPAEQRTGHDTVRAFEVVTGANDVTYVIIPDDFTAVLHPEADPTPVAALLQPFENGGLLPAGTTADLVAWVESTAALLTAAERTFIMWDKFPAYFQALALTELPAEAQPVSLAAPRKR